MSSNTVFQKHPTVALDYAVLEDDLVTVASYLSLMTNHQLEVYTGRAANIISNYGTPAVVQLFIDRMNTAVDDSHVRYFLKLAVSNSNLVVADYLWNRYPDQRTAHCADYLHDMTIFNWVVDHNLVAEKSLMIIDYCKLVANYRETQPEFLKSIVSYFNFNNCVVHLVGNSTWMWMIDNLADLSVLPTRDDMLVFIGGNYISGNFIQFIDYIMVNYQPRLTAAFLKMYLTCTKHFNAQYVKKMLQLTKYMDTTFSITDTGVLYVTSTQCVADVPHSFINNRYIYCGDKLPEVLPALLA